MQDAAAGAHPLRQPRVDHAVVAGGVLVDQGALEHPGDDLHVLVRVGVEPGAGVDDVVVVDQQQPVVGVGRVVVVAEGERVLGVQPPELALVAVLGAADVDGGGEVHGAHGRSFEAGGASAGRRTATLGPARHGHGRPAAAGAGQAFLIAETSNSRTILSLTRTPPVSSAAFQVTP